MCISSICFRTLYMGYLLSILVYCIFFIALYKKNTHGMSASDGSGLIPNSQVIYGFETSLKSTLEHFHKKRYQPLKNSE